jgi:hypothetical protein
MTSSLPNGTDMSESPIELSFTLPQSPQVRIHLHLTILQTSLVLFLTTTSAEYATSSSPLGSFVYAMPNVTHSRPLNTPYLANQN